VVFGRDVQLGSKMTRLPIVYVQQSGIQRLVSRGFRLDHSGRESTQISVRELPGFTAYESVPHCNTCDRFSPNETLSCGFCKDKSIGYKVVPIDGSGYCHEHSQLKDTL
jgi:hypothetical protein